MKGLWEKDGHNHKTLRFTWLFVLVSFFLQGLSLAQAGLRPDAVNRVVVILDGSGSFKKRQPEALERTVTLLEEIAKTRLHRWESGADEIAIIGLDALPEVIWKGNLKKLKAMDRKTWTERMKARSADFSMCTDVGEAFRLAARQLEGNPRYVSKYLLVFSDLIDEPPTTSVCRCRKANGNPPAGFPWKALKDVSVSVFWMPPNQVLTWRRAIRAHGLEKTFTLYSDAESAKVAISPPPRPEVKVTEEDRRREAQRIKEKVIVATEWVGGAVAVLIGLVVAIAVVGVIVRRNGQRASRGSQQG